MSHQEKNKHVLQCAERKTQFWSFHVPLIQISSELLPLTTKAFYFKIKGFSATAIHTVCSLNNSVKSTHMNLHVAMWILSNHHNLGCKSELTEKQMLNMKQIFFPDVSFCGKLRPIMASFMQYFPLPRNTLCLRLAGSYLERHACSAAPLRRKQPKACLKLETQHSQFAVQDQDHKTKRQMYRQTVSLFFFSFCYVHYKYFSNHQ